jgi:hypothetical protein
MYTHMNRERERGTCTQRETVSHVYTTHMHTQRDTHMYTERHTHVHTERNLHARARIYTYS